MKKFIFSTLFLFSCFTTGCGTYLDFWEWHSIETAPCRSKAIPIFERMKAFHEKTGVEPIYIMICKEEEKYKGRTDDGVIAITHRGWTPNSAPGAKQCKFDYFDFKGKKVFGPIPTDPLCP